MSNMKIYVNGGVVGGVYTFDFNLPSYISLEPDIGVDKAHYKELLRKYNIAFLNKNKTEMSKLEKEMKQWRNLV